MARPLDLRQRQELAAFANALFDAAGYPSTAEWARDSDYPAPNLSELRNAKAGVDGYNLFRLIRAAAVRVGVTPEELAGDLARRVNGGSAESIDGRLEELSGLVKRALELLESRLPPQAERRKRAG